MALGLCLSLFVKRRGQLFVNRPAYSNLSARWTMAKEVSNNMVHRPGLLRALRKLLNLEVQISRLENPSVLV